MSKIMFKWSRQTFWLSENPRNLFRFYKLLKNLEIGQVRFSQNGSKSLPKFTSENLENKWLEEGSHMSSSHMFFKVSDVNLESDFDPFWENLSCKNSSNHNKFLGHCTFYIKSRRVSPCLFHGDGFNENHEFSTCLLEHLHMDMLYQPNSKKCKQVICCPI